MGFFLPSFVIILADDFVLLYKHYYLELPSISICPSFSSKKLYNMQVGSISLARPTLTALRPLISPLCLLSLLNKAFQI